MRLPITLIIDLNIIIYNTSKTNGKTIEKYKKTIIQNKSLLNSVSSGLEFMVG